MKHSEITSHLSRTEWTRIGLRDCTQQLGVWGYDERFGDSAHQLIQAERDAGRIVTVQRRVSDSTTELLAGRIGA